MWKPYCKRGRNIAKETTSFLLFLSWHWHCLNRYTFFFFFPSGIPVFFIIIPWIKRTKCGKDKYRRKKHEKRRLTWAGNTNYSTGKNGEKGLVSRGKGAFVTITTVGVLSRNIGAVRREIILGKRSTIKTKAVAYLWLTFFRNNVFWAFIFQLGTKSLHGYQRLL